MVDGSQALCVAIERPTVTPFNVGRALLLAFIATQVADGWLTYIGLVNFGLHIEANPLVAWYVTACGPAAGMLATKGFAVACALPLYKRALHGILALLTLFYIVTAILPWLHVLSLRSF
jgi:hypothetical protein